MAKADSNRDADSQKILGFFFVALGLLVLVGTLWTLENFRAMVVNLGSGIVLTAVGAVMLAISRRLRAPN